MIPSRIHNNQPVPPCLSVRAYVFVLALFLVTANFDVRITNGQGETVAATSNERSDTIQTVWDESHARGFYPPGTPSEKWSEIYTTVVFPHRRTGNSKANIHVQVRYHDPQASEVTLVWGLNKFGPAPKKLPEKTVLTYNRSHMNTPMNFDGNAFVVDLEISDNTRLDYAFTINRNSNKKEVNIWRGGRNQGYHTTMVSVASADEVIDPSSSWSIRDYILIAASFGITAILMARLIWYAIHDLDK